MFCSVLHRQEDILNVQVSFPLANLHGPLTKNGLPMDKRENVVPRNLPHIDQRRDQEQRPIIWVEVEAR